VRMNLAAHIKVVMFPGIAGQAHLSAKGPTFSVSSPRL
jgi:hypothetical protein